MFGWVVLLGGCMFWRGQGDSRDPAAQFVSEGERFYMQRSSAEKLDQAISAWQAGLLEVPDNPILLGLLTQAYTERAVSQDAHRPDGFIVAREHGVQCLRTDPFLAGVMQTYGGRLVPRALRTVGPELLDCLTWTALSWSRWLQHHGAAGAGLDLEIVAAMAKKAVAIDPDHDRARPMHALGIAMALPPAPMSPDLDGAEEALTSALKAAPERLWIQVDLAELIYGPRGDEEGFHAALDAVLDADPDSPAPERLVNTAAQERAALLKEQGSPGWSP